MRVDSIFLVLVIRLKTQPPPLPLPLPLSPPPLALHIRSPLVFHLLIHPVTEAGSHDPFEGRK
jgi:hypothetical protein